MLRDGVRDGDPFRLALLDFHMPGMTGLELARDISTDADLSRTRLALLTSSGFDGDPVTVREAGVRAYLAKPVRQSVLYDRLAELVADDDSELLDTGATPAEVLEVLETAGPPAANGGPKLRVLVVEDNEVNRRLVTAMLETLG